MIGDEMRDAMVEAIRITKPGGSLVFTHFVEPDSDNIKSIKKPMTKNETVALLSSLDVEAVLIDDMKATGLMDDMKGRYFAVATKTKTLKVAVRNFSVAVGKEEAE